MPDLKLRLAALVQHLADGPLLAETLLFPDVSCLGDDFAHLRKMLARNTRMAIKKEIPAGSLYRRRLGQKPQVASIEVTVPPLKDDLCRSQGAVLKFHYLHWRHGDDAVIAYVPALRIEVLAESSQQLNEQLEPQIRSALSRIAAAGSLRTLAELDRVQKLDVKPLALAVKLPTLKQAALKEKEDESERKSVLKEVAANLHSRESKPIYERDVEVKHLAQWLTARTPRSVLLVGRSGVGKTALVRELARRRSDFALAATPLWSTSGSRIMAGVSGFGMWQQRCQQLVREAGKTKAIVHFDNLFELVEVGKGGCNTQGMAALLRPSIERGELLAIVECTPEQLALLEREDPQLLEAFAQMEIAEPSAEQTRAILAQAAAQLAAGAIEPEALATLDRLHRRYATYSASPGRPLRFLRNLLEDRASKVTLTSRDVTAAFSHETGLPRFMLDDAVPLDIAATRAWFAQRVIGQSEPVELVVDLISTVKAGLARGGKPIASLLFIGPTGVGKTEMAKSLAEFLYQDAGRMIRFDMSEYAHGAAVERLIGGGASAQGLLTQKVRDQPFMVVLLDEFEKAHPLVFDLLLQVLGEGRLTDGKGRVADFTNAVVIMTSNLGAESYRRSAFGFAGEAAAGAGAKQHFEREVKGFLRPEMFNRLDQIVPFAPLDRETIAGIARRELAQIARRDGLQLRKVELDVEPAVVEHLAERGFDVRYGARPLKRAIERQLVAPLADQMGRYPTHMPLSCRVQLRDGGLDLHTAAIVPKDRAGRGYEDRSERTVLQAVIDLRRQVQLLSDSGMVLRLRNEIIRLKQAERQRERRRKKRGEPERFVFGREQSQLHTHEELINQVDALAGGMNQVEDRALCEFYSGRGVPATIDAERAAHAQALTELLFSFHRLEGSRSNLLCIAIYGEELDRVMQLASAYEVIATGQNETVTRFWLKRHRPESSTSKGGLRPCMRLKNRARWEGEPSFTVVDVYHPHGSAFFAPSDDCIGVALKISGERIVDLLDSETGRHDFIRGQGRTEACYVDTKTGRLIDYAPISEVGQRGVMNGYTLRRLYDFPREICRDPLAKLELHIHDGDINEPLARAAHEYLNQRLWSWLE